MIHGWNGFLFTIFKLSLRIAAFSDKITKRKWNGSDIFLNRLILPSGKEQQPATATLESRMKNWFCYMLQYITGLMVTAVYGYTAIKALQTEAWNFNHSNKLCNSKRFRLNAHYIHFVATMKKTRRKNMWMRGRIRKKK